MRHVSWRLPVLAALLLCAARAPGNSLEFIGATLFSNPVDIVEEGNTAYILYPSGYAILDITSRYDPTLYSEGFLPGEGKDLIVQDSILYVSCGSAGLITMNVSDPSVPVLLDTAEAPWSFGRMDINHGRLYVTDARDGLLTFGRSNDPEHPEYLSTYETDDEIADILTLGWVAYLATVGGGIQVVDITTWELEPVTDITEMDGAGHLAGSGSTLYVSRGMEGIWEVDVSDSSAPVISPEAFTGTDSTCDIVLLDSFLVAVSYDTALLILDRDDLTGAPLAETADTMRIGRIAPWDGGVYLTGRNIGIEIVDHLFPLSATNLSRRSFPNIHVDGVVLQGDTLFLAAGLNGVILVSIENELDIDSLSALKIGDDVSACVVRDTLLYVGTVRGAEPGIVIYNLATNDTLSFSPLSGAVQDISLRDDLLYVCAGTSGLYVVDISDPAAPSLVDSIPQEGDSSRFTRSLSFSGDLLALAEGEGGVRIVDISDPAHPVAIASYQTAEYVMDVHFQGIDRLYVSQIMTGILVLDVSDPALPDSAGLLDMSVLLDRAFVLSYLDGQGGVLFLTEWGGFGGTGRFHVLSLSDPDSPELKLTITSSGMPSRFVMADDRAYVAAGYGGIEIFGASAYHDLITIGVYNPYANLDLISASDERILAVDMDGKAWPLFVQEGQSLRRGIAYDFETGAGGLLIADRIAYVTLDGEDRIAVMDLALVTEATLARWIDYPGDSQGAEGNGMFLADSLLYVALGPAGLAIYDVSVAGSEQIVGRFVSEDGGNLGIADALEVYVTDGIAYVVTRDRNQGLFLLDVNDPSSPSFLSKYNGERRAFNVIVHENFAYLSSRITGVSVIDVSIPTLPVLAAERSDLYQTREMAISEQTLFLARRAEGITILDLESPQIPSEVWSEPTSDRTDDIALSGTYLAIADRSAAIIYAQDFANADQTAPSYTIGILPNMFVNAYMDFVVVASEPLTDKPVITFRMGEIDSMLTVYRIDTPRNVYHATYRLTETGTGTVLVEGEDISGNKSESNRGFSVSFIRGAKGGSIYDKSGKVEVVVAAGASSEESYVLLTRIEEWEIEAAADGKPDPLAGPYRLALGRVESSVSVRLYDAVQAGTEETPALYLLDGESWREVEGTYDPVRNVVETELPGSSLFLFANASDPPPVPFTIVVEPNRPNPFNPETTLLFHLSKKSDVRVVIYDVAGRLVRLLIDRPCPAGTNLITWDGADNNGRDVGSGVYFSRVEAAGRVYTGKMLLVR